jgi:hypothetical protein
MQTSDAKDWRDRSGAKRHAIAFVLFILTGCTSGKDDLSEKSYGPCNGELGSCRLANHIGGLSGDGCLCTLYCAVDSDCPLPKSGTSVPTCQPYGDYVANGHTAQCVLPCDSATQCPDGMSCFGGECWVPTTK